MSLFPLMVELGGKVVVVVGAGAVGRRKADALRDAGAVVRVVEAYSPEQLDGAHLVFACATPEVNARVVADAKERGVWVNAASDPESGDVFLPSVLRHGDLTIAVSTGGASPSLSKRIRDRLAMEFDESYADWVRLLGELRREVLATIPDGERRRAVLNDLTDWRWLELLRAEGVEAARAAGLEAIRLGASSSSLSP